jgi:RHH-type proline utilization regulon transcriptional repressor/proline dehydrogenase/delta 1-pyrroline-5-carboxylate dehydrogenase
VQALALGNAVLAVDADPALIEKLGHTGAPVEAVAAGNIYVNRNQIGAVVGSQPFGGMGLSGTGPKAGGPNYVARFRRRAPAGEAAAIPSLPLGAAPGDSGLTAKMDALAARQAIWADRRDRAAVLRTALSGETWLSAELEVAARVETGPVDLPGPTGESNRLSLLPRGIFVCLGEAVPIVQALALGNAVLAVDADPALIEKLGHTGAPVEAAAEPIDPAELSGLPHLAGVCARGDEASLRTIRQALARRDGPILPLVSEAGDHRAFIHEKVLCIDTTAAGGNATLLAQADA